MGIDNPTVIDSISTAKDGSRVQLSIFGAEDWADEAAHLFSLQAKLNAYLDFVRSGQVFEEYPTARDARLLINVIFRLPPVAKAKGLLEHADRVARQIGFRWATKLRLNHPHPHSRRGSARRP